MKLKKEFIAHNGAGESLLVPAGGAEFVGIVRGNRTFGAILDLLKEETDEDAVVRGMCERFNGDRERIASDVHRAIERVYALLEEERTLYELRIQRDGDIRTVVIVDSFHGPGTRLK